MRRATSAILAVLLTCQLCMIVFGEGAEPGARAPWRMEPRQITATGDELTQNVDGVPSSETFPPELTLLPLTPEPDLYANGYEPIRGVYATAYSTGSSVKFKQILDFIDQSEVNAIVIDVKDDSGTLSYASGVPLAIKIGSSRARFSPEAVLAALRLRNIYPIARIVVFKDPYLAAQRPDLAVRSKAGGLWNDRRGQLWVDPHNRVVQQYAIDIAKEAARKGFREIQFDYVRFTSDGKLSDCLYPFATGQSKADVIKDFLIKARRELKPFGAAVSADVFGLTCSSGNDLGIGQKIEKIASAVDVISPMVYPSHYYKGTYGIPDPDLAPYQTILTSLRAATPRIAGLGVRMRPWLQDFSLRNKYGREQLLAQIKAVYDAGYMEWIFWNPSNTYKLEKYNLK